MANFVSDMDGVIYRGKTLIKGADEFINRVISSGHRLLFLTNNSEQTPVDLLHKLERMGVVGLTQDHFLTSAMATAKFLQKQRQMEKRQTVYVVGGGGLVNEIYNAGFSISESKPDYVVVGKTRDLNYNMLNKAVAMIKGGAKFIGTNPDVIDPTESGEEPACGTILAAIEKATGKAPYVVGKPNPLMMLIAKETVGAKEEPTFMIGDRMDTDIVGGMEEACILAWYCQVSLPKIILANILIDLTMYLRVSQR